MGIGRGTTAIDGPLLEYFLDPPLGQIWMKHAWEVVFSLQNRTQYQIVSKCVEKYQLFKMRIHYMIYEHMAPADRSSTTARAQRDLRQGVHNIPRPPGKGPLRNEKNTPRFRPLYFVGPLRSRKRTSPIICSCGSRLNGEGDLPLWPLPPWLRPCTTEQRAVLPTTRKPLN